MTALKAYEAIKHPVLKRHIDNFARVLYGTDGDTFAILENADYPQ